MTFMELMATLSLDTSKYDEGLDKAKSEAEGVGGKVLNALGKVGAAVGKATLIAVGAAATGVAAITKQSVQAYAEYEQLEGGVKKLYGNMGMSLEDYAESVGKSTAEVSSDYANLEKAQNIVLDNAKEAYKTSGMSMNQYMDMATSFSASLINSLGGDTVKAAEQTDVAMKAISDNFNTFGGDIGMIQGAFQGFAKQNYTMLDNLKLGYGGTKQEMERLIDDANEYAASIGEASDLSIESFSDIVTAIDLIQQKQQIAGTTEREAATTIQGSLNMTKSAWENLLVALADGEMDLSTYISNLVSSASTLVKNVMPVVEQVLNGIGELVTQLGPVIAAELPKLISDTLPKLLEAGISMVEAILTGIRDNADMVIDGLITIAEALVNGAVTLLPLLLEVGLKLIVGIMEGLTEAIPKLIPVVVDVVLQIVQTLVDNLQMLLDAGLQLIEAVGEGIIEALPTIIDALPEIIGPMVEFFINQIPMMTELGVRLLAALIANLPEILAQIGIALSQILTEIIDSFTNEGTGEEVMDAGVSLFMQLVGKIGEAITHIVAKCGEVVEAIKTKITEAVSAVATIGSNIMQSFINAIASFIGTVASTISSIINTIISILSSVISTAMSIGSSIISSFVSGIRNLIGSVTGAVSSIVSTIVSTISSLPSKMLSIGSNIIQGLINGITGAGANLGSTLTNVVSSAVNKAKAFLGIHSPSTLFAEIGKYSVEGLEVGWENEMPKAEKTIVDSLGFIDGSMISPVKVDTPTSSDSSGTSTVSNQRSYTGDTFVIPVYIGQTLFAQAVVDGQTLENYRSGGR